MSRNLRAYTLVEILAAVAIFTLVASAVFALYWAVLRSAERVERDSSTGMLENGLAQLIRDLTCAVHLDTESECALQLELETPGSSASYAAWRLTFCTTTPFENPLDPRWYGIEKVLYRWTPTEPTLVRIARPLSGSDPRTSRTNLLAQRVEGLSVRLYDGSDWHASWSTGAWPRAARVVWVDRGQTFTAETFVASGLIFSPSASSVKK